MLLTFWQKIALASYLIPTTDIMAEKDIEKTAEAQSEEPKATKKEKKDALKQSKAKIEELEAALAKEKNDYLLLYADLENFRRRSAAERLELISTASEKVICDLLEIADDFERAVANGADEGTTLIYNKFMNVLKAKGLKEIQAKGETFDTDTMEAIAQFPIQDEALKGKVYDVTQKGYKLGDKVIRFAKVVVAI